jgi:hypothetical protein
MKALLKYRPDLRACEVEDRLVPATSDLGATVLTTGGYVLLLTPFHVIVADPFGESGGLGFLTPSAMSGSARVAGLLPTNSAGVPGLVTTAPTGSNGGGAGTIIVGSGANDAGAANIPPVTRNTTANDALNPAPVIGRVSADQSAVLPPEQVYRGGLPVTSTVGFSLEVPGQRAAQCGPTAGDRPADLAPEASRAVAARGAVRRSRNAREGMGRCSPELVGGRRRLARGHRLTSWLVVPGPVSSPIPGFWHEDDSSPKSRIPADSPVGDPGDGRCRDRLSKRRGYRGRASGSVQRRWTILSQRGQSAISSRVRSARRGV